MSEELEAVPEVSTIEPETSTAAATPKLDEVAVKIAVKIIKQFEGCNLVAYPDPASPLYVALSTHNMLQKYMRGEIKWNDLPEHFQELSGEPFTCGWGNTQGVTKETVWTALEADSELESKVRWFMQGVLKSCPQLVLESSSRIAACTSLAYNTGLANFSKSTVCKKTEEKDYHAAADAFALWDKAGGKVVEGLVRRRKTEADLYRAV